MLTVEEIVETMERRFGKANRIWVMDDRGMVSAENLAWLNETGRRYVIGTPRSELKRWARQLAESSDWRRIREDVEVKICRGPEGNETFLLCRSAARIEKERAMHERFCTRIEAGSWRRWRGASPTPNGGSSAGRSSARSAGSWSATPARGGSPWDLSGRRCAQRLGPEAQVDGAPRVRRVGEPLRGDLHILRSNVPEWSDEELWRTYLQLTEAEAAFRIHKSDLAIRPVWHQKAGRIKAHILVCFLGYAL